MVLVVAVPLACARSDDSSSNLDRSDRPAAASPAKQAVAGVDSQRVVLAVKGMYCASCEQTVVTMLRRTAGVIRADVSVQRGEATVSYDSTRTSPAQLVQIVKSLGYDAAVKRT
jgi:copper chaperone CopZ